MAATVIPTLFFLLVEGLLWVCGVGFATSFFIKLEQRGGYTTNPRFGWRFFPPTQARAPVVCEMLGCKPAGIYRIFVLGSSAAQGHPNPAFSFGRMLAAMLRDQFPDTRFEVINAAMTAINSHVALPIARDCARHQPDLFVVYMGNNEVIGPYGSGTIFQGFLPSLTLIRSNIFLKSTYIGQVFARILTGGQDRREWQGMSMFLEHRVAADDPRMGRLYSHFRSNLTDICDVARKSGAQVILCTVGTNLKDSPPFASFTATISSVGPAERERLNQAASVAAEAHRFEEAVEQFLGAAKIDDRRADRHFRLGLCLFGMDRFREARSQFILARDLDALRLPC